MMLSILLLLRSAVFASLKIIYRLCIVLFLVCVALPVSANTSVADEPAILDNILGDIVGAVCVIRHDNKMIMLSEVITKKMSLPGGYIDKGDTPEAGGST